jgi:hypothetical protein
MLLIGYMANKLEGAILIVRLVWFPIPPSVVAEGY